MTALLEGLHPGRMAHLVTLGPDIGKIGLTETIERLADRLIPLVAGAAFQKSANE